MPRLKSSNRHTVSAIGNRLNLESSKTLPYPKDQDQQAAIMLDSNDVQPLVAKAKAGAGSKPATRRKPTADADVAAEQQQSKNTQDARPLKICDVCGNMYKYQHLLDSHMRRHNNVRPYPCEVCKKAFVSNMEMSRHMRVHTGQKPYGCKFCNRRFSDFGSNRKHERTHTDERPFVCEVCNKGFTYAHGLTVHKRIHTGEKPFHCTHCDKGFTKKAYLLTHLDCHRRATLLLEKDFKLNTKNLVLRLPSKNDNYKVDDNKVDGAGDTIEDGYDAIEDGYDAIEDGYDAIEDGYDAIEDGYDAIEDGYDAIGDDDEDNTDCTTYTLVFDNDEELKECTVTSGVIGDSKNPPDEHNVVDDDDADSTKITVGVFTTDIVADSKCRGVTNELDDVQFILQ